MVRAQFAGLYCRVVILTQGALLLRDFAATPIESRRGLAFARTYSGRNVVANGLPRRDALAGLAVPDRTVVRRCLIPQRVDTVRSVGLIEILTQRR